MLMVLSFLKAQQQHEARASKLWSTKPTNECVTGAVVLVVELSGAKIKLAKEGSLHVDVK